MIRWFIALVLMVILGVLAHQTYGLTVKRGELKKELAELKTEREMIEKESKELEERIEFLSNKENLEKELRARFNYRLPNENLIIVVPEENE